MSNPDDKNPSSRGSKAVLPWAVGMDDHAGDGSTAPADATARSSAATEVQPGQIKREFLHGVGAG
jgi:hypothetical protein